MTVGFPVLYKSPAKRSSTCKQDRGLRKVDVIIVMCGRTPSKKDSLKKKSRTKIKIKTISQNYHNAVQALDMNAPIITTEGKIKPRPPWYNKDIQDSILI